MEHESQQPIELRYTFSMRRISVVFISVMMIWMSACVNKAEHAIPKSPAVLITSTFIMQTTGVSQESTPTSTPVFTVTPTQTPSLTPTFSYLPLILPKGPDVIYEGDNTSMKIFWQGDPEKRYQIQLGMDGEFDQPTVDVAVDIEKAGLYSYTFTDLIAGQRYEYRLSADNMAAEGSFFAGLADKATDLKFIVYGDTRSNPDQHDRVAAAISQQFLQDTGNQTIVFHTGDLVNGGDTAESWEKEFFDPQYTNIRYLLANIPVIPVNGNHDGSNDLFTDYFPYPYVRDRYWSFDYGPAHFTVLDQYAYLEEESREYEWLLKDLQSTQKKWKFILLHEPGWSAGGGNVDNPVVQKLLEPVFVKYGVSIVFGAHNHYYARAEKDGINHLTLGTGGAPTYTPRSTHKYVVFKYNGLGFEKIQISGNRLDGWFVDIDGTLMDHFFMEIDK